MLSENKNAEIPKIFLPIEEPPWDPSTEKYSETHITDHGGQIIVHVIWQGTSV